MTVPLNDSTARPRLERPGLAAGSFGAWLLSLPVLLYRFTLSPLLRPSCRFHPSCSVYCLAALAKHGAFGGLWLSARRLSRCHPFHPGGLDPVPLPGGAPRGE